MRVLITRPRDDAEPIAAALAETGIDSVIEPLMTIEPLGGAATEFGQFQAILLTSRNGVRALAAATDRRDLPLFVVGDATAALAREHGFANVESAAGDSAALAELVSQRLDPQGGPLYHGSGSAVAGDLTGTLSSRGFSVESGKLYAAQPVASLSDDVRRLLEQRALDAVMFFSPRTAQTFVTVVRDARLASSCGSTTAICMSPAVARALRPVEFGGVRIAGRPDARAMLAVADELRAELESVSNVTEPKRDDTASPSETGEQPAPQDETDLPDEALPAEDQPEEVPASRNRGGLRTGIWLALLVVVLAGIGIYTWPQWRGYLSPSRAADATRFEQRITALEAEIARLQSELAAARGVDTGKIAADMAALVERINAAEQALARPATPAPELAQQAERLAGIPPRLDELQSRLDSIEKGLVDVRAVATQAQARERVSPTLMQRLALLESRLDSLAERPAPGPEMAQNLAAVEEENRKLAAALDTLAERFAAVEAAATRGAAASAASRLGALVVAAGQLREALAGGKPFAEELATLRAVAADDESVGQIAAALDGYAAKGVPTREQLIQSFPKKADAAVRAALGAPDGSWVDRTLGRLASVVTVRRVGEDVTGDTPQAVLARAEARIRSGDISGGNEALAALSGAPARVVAGWRHDAEARLAADQALAGLTRLTVQRLTGTGSGDAR